MNKKIALGSDHAGFELKQILKLKLQQKGFDVQDFGCDSLQSIDYPDYAHPVANYVEKEGVIGVLICGSGNGISMSANKHQGIRCALCWNAEIAVMAREHNDANILSLPARYISAEEAAACLEAFINTSFEGGRHQRRVNKIACH